MYKMRWRVDDNASYLEVSFQDRWIRYDRHPLAVPDYAIPKGSKGYATMQKLLKLGYKLIPHENS